MRVLVTGGAGFLGRAIVRELRARGHEVSSASRGAHPELEAEGVRTFRADVADAPAIERAIAGHEAVVHAAARAGIWGPAAAYARTNVEGTRNVLEGCARLGVARLVHTSSPSVCFDGRDHVRAGNELPYATRFLCPYPQTKAAAERLVLAANGRAGLATVALRPHLIFGPGDPHLVPPLIARARERRLVRVGPGTNEVALTFVENAAAAHADALEALVPGARHAGRAYFVAQRDAVRLWTWIAELLGRLGIEPPTRALPLPLAYAAATACEGLWTVMRVRTEPPLTRFLALQLARSHSYDLGPAERDFGYRERLGMEEATARLVAACLAAEASVRA
jgi:nucleoside-diphosphate-sugar epimerase